MQQQQQGGADSSSRLHHQLVEEASPISSRPPAAANLEDFMRMSGAGGGDEGGGPSGNRWPRQETLALLKIRSDMDAVFRDATVKGPLWEDVSRKLGELGYRRSAKKCKEKFENVHKYYKRTKEGRAGRQDGKTYKFFTELEAFHSATASATPPTAPPPLPHSSVTLDVAPVSVGIPMPSSSSRLPSNPSTGTLGAAPQPPPSGSQPPSSAPPFFGVSFSSDSSAGSEYSQGSGDEESEDEREADAVFGGGSRKRKRSSSAKHSGMGRMMGFFEGLMKQVMQKQELMQQRFLEAIEKREQERMLREEAWKRQEMARLARDHELMAQERAIAASRDAAIVTFLQKITGQTIQLPTGTATVTVPTAPPPAPAPAQPSPHATTAPPSQPPAAVHQQQPQQQQMIRQQHHRPQSTQFGSTGAEIVVAVPEQQVPPTHEVGGTTTATATESPSSSRWPKAEVLALIKIRSGLEPRYQEAGPKGPLWEEISAAMLRQGFRRNAKRCKEKWENINKYYKKVKESNKSRPEDAKTCPYFHELDALYRQKILGGGTSTSAAVGVGGPAPQLLASNYPQQPSAGEQQHHEQQQQTSIQSGHQRDNQNNAGDQASKAGGLFVEQGSAGQAHNKPEDLVRELMMEQQHNEEQGQPPFSLDDIDKMEEGDESENMDEEDDEEDDEESDEERKMEAYKIEFQRQKGGGNSFLAMVHQ